MIRYEIVDASPKILPMLYDTKGKASEDDGFEITALIYWGRLAQDSTPGMSKELRLYKSGKIAGRTLGPTFDRIEVQAVAFTLNPRTVKISYEDDLQRVVLGADGWAIGGERALGTTELPSGMRLPIYDVSATTLPDK